MAGEVSKKPAAKKKATAKTATKKPAPKTPVAKKTTENKAPVAKANPASKPDAIIPAPTQEITPKMRELAEKQHGRILEMGKSISKKWSEIGEVLRDFKDNRRWEAMGYKKLDDWITAVADELGFKRSTFYDVVTTSKKLAELPPADVREIPSGNAKELARLPESKRKAMVEDAKKKPHREFRKQVESQLEGAAKERNVPFGFSVPETLIPRLEKALQVAGWQGETESRAEQLEFIVAEFMSYICQREDAKANESNEDAYDRIVGADEKAIAKATSA